MTPIPSVSLYRPLDNAKRKVRLLQPINSETVKTYHLETFTLEDAPAFNVLSCTWGPASPCFTITVNHQRTQVRSNLYSFLQHYPGEECFWIDQICIGQSNIDERNHQVELMSHIYKCAEVVIAWLEDYDDRHFHNATAKKWGFRSPTAWLCTRYFTPLWIVQDIMLAKEVCVVYGKEAWVDLNNLHADVMNAKRMNIKLRVPFSTKAILKAHGTMLEHSIESCILKFCEEGCEDARDKVYGLMGLVREKDRLAIGYNKSVGEVFLDVVLAFYRSYQTHPQGQFPITVKDYCSVLLALAEQMGLGLSTNSQLQRFMLYIWYGVGVPTDKDAACFHAFGRREIDPGTVEKVAKLPDKWCLELLNDKRYTK